VLSIAGADVPAIAVVFTAVDIVPAVATDLLDIPFANGFSNGSGVPVVVGVPAAVYVPSFYFMLFCTWSPFYG
jgi:hypothetical protein